MHHVAHLQGGERVELTEPEGLAGIVGLEEGGAEAVVGKALSVHRPAAEIAVPDPFAAFPQVVAVGLAAAAGELRALDEIRHALALVGEAQPAAEIGDRLDVIGLEPVVGIHVVGMLAHDRAHDVHGVDMVGGCRLADLGAQAGIVLQQRVDLAVLGLEGGAGGLGAPRRGAGNGRLLGVAVARRHGGGRAGRQRRQQNQASTRPTMITRNRFFMRCAAAGPQ